MPGAHLLIINCMRPRPTNPLTRMDGPSPDTPVEDKTPAKSAEPTVVPPRIVPIEVELPIIDTLVAAVVFNAKVHR